MEGWRTKKILKVVFLLGITICARCQDVSGDGRSSDEYLDDYDNNDDSTPPDTRRKIDDYRELIDELYGEDQEADSQLWIKIDDQDAERRDGFCGFETLWLLEGLKSTIDSKGDILNESNRSDLLSATHHDIQREQHLSEKQYPEKSCTKFVTALRKYRSNLDCVLGSKVVNAHFSKMDPKRDICWDTVENLWKKLIEAGDFSDKGCSSSEVYKDLVGVGQIVSGKYEETGWDSNGKLQTLELMAKFVDVISSPRRIEYLASASCKDVPVWECTEIQLSAVPAICQEIIVDTVNKVQNLIEGVGVRRPDDVFVMLDFQKDLTEILEELSKKHHLGQTRSAVLAVDNLKKYMDIMDQAIGESAQHVWTEMSETDTERQMQLVLVNNEEYIGAMTKILFDSKIDETSKTSLEREAMEIELRQLDTSNQSEVVAFQFNETSVEITELPGNEKSNKLNVYAIHYKSWAELMQKEGLQANKTVARNKTKLFVGEGGIVSLSAHTDEGKQNLPVSYKMNFKKVDLSGDVASGTRGLCMSCEYLNTMTGEWENTGCTVDSVSQTGITCNCNHTTNFAAFMSPVPIEIEMTDAQYQAKQILSYVGSTVSALALAMSLVVFNIVRPTVKNDRLKAHMSLAFALFVVHVTQLFADFVVNSEVACLSVAIVTHFFLLASFFWMLIEGIFLYLYVVQVFVHSTIEYLRWLYFAGWALPAVIVAISAGVGIPRDTYLAVHEYCEESELLYPPLPKYERCWLSAKSGMAWSFIAPALTIILINSIILFKVFQVLKEVSGRSRIRPFQPPSSSGGKKDNTSGYTNKYYGRKESESQAQPKTSKWNIQHEKEAEYGATSLTNGQTSQKSNDSPSRFDGRVPSQSYMYNRAHATKVSPEKDNSNGKHFLEDVRAAVKGALILLPILGIPWICGLWVAGNYVAMMIFILINSTQGLVIFVVYCLMNGEVKRALERRIKMAKLRSQSGRSRASSTSSLRSLSSRFARTGKNSSSSSPQK